MSHFAIKTGLIVLLWSCLPGCGGRVVEFGTFGSTSVFHGTVMADQAITLETGATLTGRALARIAAVSLDSNSIVTPTP